MVLSGLEQIREKLPCGLKGKKLGVLCHAASITSDFVHISRFIHANSECHLSAVFGPQHGLHGQTQDNMIEWEGSEDPVLNVPVYSLYGKHRKPTEQMLNDIEALIIDLQDVGARLYTYIWTVKLCIEACSEKGLPVWILDRPNPVSLLPFDGPVLKEEYFTFVGGACIPLCHRMTIGEMALWIKVKYYPAVELNVIWMKGWHRNSLFSETGLPWVLPSPNIPTLQSAIVYPGTVLAEALNISEGRGTTIPFELIGAPFIDGESLKKELDSRSVPGCIFRIHNFIPTFNKYAGSFCNGIQIHVTSPADYSPVGTALEIIDAIIETSPEGSFRFNPPPYEYETELMPFDILSGDSYMRNALISRIPPVIVKEKWKDEIHEFNKEFREFSRYPE